MADADKLAAQVEQIIGKRIAADRLAIPALPTAAMKALSLLRNPDCSLQGVSKILEMDPALAVQLVRVANSAAYGSRGARSLEQSVTFLGIEKTKTILVEVTAHRLFESKDPRIQKTCRGLWEHSVAVALLARDVAALAGSADGEDAYLAGLLHDIGKVVIAAILLEVEKALTATHAKWIESGTWLEAVEKIHRHIGVQLAEKWTLPDSIQTTIRDCSDYDPANRQSIVNFVRFANALAKVADIAVGTVDKEAASALVLVGRSLLGLEEAAVEQVTQGLAERVEKQLA